MNNLRYVHAPACKNKGGICIGYEPTDTNIATRAGRVYRMSTAVCNEKDTYTKRTGREIVSDNFRSGHYILVKIPKGEKPHMYFYNLADTMLQGW